MKALIQRVMNAKVTVNDEVINTIDQGLCVFIGISSNDTINDILFIVRKILNMKVYDDENNKKWKKSVVDKQLEVLCVSQFTLYNTWKDLLNLMWNLKDSAKLLEGNKPDFHNAMPGDKSKQFYKQFLEKLRDEYKSEKIKDGQFGAYMQVYIQNDGPVTFEIESPPQIQNKYKNQNKTESKDCSQNDTSSEAKGDTV